jgi:hypothetical protein
MPLVLIPTIWIVGLALVAGLCMAARRGDSQPADLTTQAHAELPGASGETWQGSSTSPAARRVAGAEHGELAGTGRAAA